MAKKALIYTTSNCPYCQKAKKLLKKKSVKFEEVILDEQEHRWDECEKRSGRKTVPQIFFGKEHVGGCDDLYALEEKGKLDALIKKHL